MNPHEREHSTAMQFLNLALTLNLPSKESKLKMKSEIKRGKT